MFQSFLSNPQGQEYGGNGSAGKKSACNSETQETWVWSLDQEDPLEKEIATHSTILAWEIPWTEEPGGVQGKGLWSVEHDWATKHTYKSLVKLIRYHKAHIFT